MVDLYEVKQAVGDLDEDKLQELLDSFVEKNPTAADAMAVLSACQEGMAIVGELFEKEEYFVGDLIFSGELLMGAINTLKPFIGSATKEKAGSIVLGTVSGDIHDIGKNIFKNMAEAAGFEVYDLGIDLPAGAFVEKIKEVKPNIVGMSGVLTLALDSMMDTVNEIKNAGLRDDVKIIIGGNPVTKEACDFIKADAFTTNAAEGVKICKEWVK